MTKKDLEKLNKEKLQAVCTLLTIAYTEGQTKKDLIALIEGDEKLPLVAINDKGEFVFGEPKDEEAEETSDEVEADKAKKAEPVKVILPEWDEEFEALQKKGFDLIKDIKELSNKRRKAGKPNARLDAAVSQVERLIKNNFIK